MSGKKELYIKLNLKFRKWRAINKWIDRVLLSILLFTAVFVGSALTQSFMFLGQGLWTEKYHSFAQLMEINPDTVAWLIMDGTHIDHPIVRSTDNFDYLDKGFDGKFYAGGTLFMDKDNRDFEDSYCIIHGHHMAAGAMFGDLEKYLDPGFFEENRTGQLLTPEYDYDIVVFASGIFNAYDRNVYSAGNTVPVGYITDNSVNIRDAGSLQHVLVLSTCLDEMTDNRAVVFCALSNRRAHS